MKILLNDEEIKEAIKGFAHPELHPFIEESDIAFAIVGAKAQLKKFVEYLESLTFYDDAEGESAKGLCKHIKEALLREIE